LHEYLRAMPRRPWKWLPVSLASGIWPILGVGPVTPLGIKGAPRVDVDPRTIRAMPWPGINRLI
jgi:hypothetical protein